MKKRMYIWKVFLTVLVVAIVSLGLGGCSKSNEHSRSEHPTSDEPGDEHPTKTEHPK